MGNNQIFYNGLFIFIIVSTIDCKNLKYLAFINFRSLLDVYVKIMLHSFNWELEKIRWPNVEFHVTLDILVLERKS